MERPQEPTGPVLEIRATYRAHPHYVPGSLEVQETLALPIGADPLLTAKALDKWVHTLARELVADRLGRR